MNRRRIWPPIRYANPDQQIFRLAFAYFHNDIKVSALVENARIDQLVLSIVFGSPLIFVNQLCVRKFGLRVFVQILHVGMSWRIVQVKVILFHVLAMVSFVTIQSQTAAP